MDAEFWLRRWEEGQTGFHNDEVLPLLPKHWPALALPAGSRVFVPLAGKSLDMAWLAGQGHPVLGVELSPIAVREFFAGRAQVPGVHESALGVHHRAGGIELVQGDVFNLDAATLAGCAGVYDRAALIALPPAMRGRYVAEVYGRLPVGCAGLLITLEYPQHERAGPPFSVKETEVRRLFEPDWNVEVLERRDILDRQPAFQAEGVSALATAVYRLRRLARPS